MKKLLIEKSSIGMTYGIDYWIAITSVPLRYNRFVRAQKRDNGRSDKVFWVMTTDVWEQKHTPPSLFEYITITAIMCSNDFGCSLYFHKHLKTKGCIFDFTVMKEHRRITVSNLCAVCIERVSYLEKSIVTKTGKT